MPGRFPEVQIDTSRFYIDGKVWHELEPKDDEIVIHKSSYGAFIDTPLETILRNLGKDTVIIVGVIANMCCSMTARQAYERGFKVVFGSDVTGIDDPDLLEYELMVLRKGFAKVLELKEIIQLLNI